MRSRQKVKILRAIVNSNSKKIASQDKHISRLESLLIDFSNSNETLMKKLNDAKQSIDRQQIHIEQLKSELSKRKSFRGKLAALFS